MALRVGLIGFGTVGTGTVKTLLANPTQIRQRAGTGITLKAIADLDWETDRGVDISDVKQSTDAWELIRDPDLDVIVELVGGTTVAKDFVLGALEHNKDVVTANKALLAAHGAELFRTADRQGRKIHFEGSVGGGIPIIQSLYGGLASARIREIHAIINGTSNYILTQMGEHGRSFDSVLREAQKLATPSWTPPTTWTATTPPIRSWCWPPSASARRSTWTMFIPRASGTSPWRISATAKNWATG